MTGPLSAAQQARAPYHVVVSLTVCRCDAAPEYMSTHRDLDRAVQVATGYWSVYMAFWGHLPRLLSVSIVDVRDGTVAWRNGRHMMEVASAKTVSDDAIAHAHPGRTGRDRGGRARTPGRVSGGYGA